LIKNSQPFGKKFQKTAGGIFFYSRCISAMVLTQSDNQTYIYTYIHITHISTDPHFLLIRRGSITNIMDWIDDFTD